MTGVLVRLRREAGGRSWVLLVFAVAAAAAGATVAASGRLQSFVVIAGLAAALTPLLTARRLALVVLPASIALPPGLMLSLAGLEVSPSRIVLTVCAIGVALQKFKPANRLGIGRGKSIRLIAVFLLGWWLVTTASLISHLSNAGSVPDFLQLTYDACLAVVVGWASIRTKKDWHLLCKAIIAVLATSSILAVVEFAAGRYILPSRLGLFETRLRLGWLRPRGLMPHPIVLAVTSGVGLLLVLGLRIAEAPGGTPKLSRLKTVLLVCLFSSSIFLSQSRGAQSALVGTLIIAVLVSGRTSVRSKWMLALALGATVVITPLGSQLRNQFEGGDGTAANLELGLSAEYRQQLVPALTAFAQHHPLGVGPGVSMDGSVYGYFNGSTIDFSRTIDSAYLVALYKFGYLGLITMTACSTAAAFLVTRLGRKRWRQTHESIIFFVGLGLISVVLVGLFVATFSWGQLNVLFWLLAGSGLASERLPNSPEPTRAEALEGHLTEPRWDSKVRNGASSVRLQQAGSSN